MVMTESNRTKVVLVLAIILSCMYNVSCKNYNASSNTSNKSHWELEQDRKNFQIDTLESGLLCYNEGSYIVTDYSYVSPSTAKRYAYDYKGRKVFEEGYTYSGSYTFAAWDYDNEGKLMRLYVGDTFGHTEQSSSEHGEDNGLFMLVNRLTECSLWDSAIVNYVFEYYSDGHVRRVYNPHNNLEIVCHEGGEITFRIYEMAGLSTSTLIGNDALNVEFSVREPKSTGTWTEALYLGYNRIAHMVYKNNRLDSFEAFSPENGNSLARLDCVEKGDTLVYTWVKSDENIQKRTYVCGNLIKDETISQWGTILKSLSYDKCDGKNDIVCRSKKYNYSQEKMVDESQYKISLEEISLEKLREYIVNNI